MGMKANEKKKKFLCPYFPPLPFETLFRLSGTFADLEVSGNKESAFPGSPGSDNPGSDTRIGCHRAGDGVGTFNCFVLASGQSYLTIQSSSQACCQWVVEPNETGWTDVGSGSAVPWPMMSPADLSQTPFSLDLRNDPAPMCCDRS